METRAVTGELGTVDGNTGRHRRAGDSRWEFILAAAILPGKDLAMSAGPGKFALMKDLVRPWLMYWIFCPGAQGPQSNGPVSALQRPRPWQCPWKTVWCPRGRQWRSNARQRGSLRPASPGSKGTAF